MALLDLEPLEEILNDLGPTFALSHQQKAVLCDNINTLRSIYEDQRRRQNDGIPYKRGPRWQKIQQTSEKALELLHDFDFDMEAEIDRVRGHPEADALAKMLVSNDFSIVREIGRAPDGKWPSQQAIDEANRIKESLSLLIKIAQSGIDFDHARKDSTRKHNPFRDFLILALAKHYEFAFNIKVSARREGPWPQFLSRILSILLDKEVNPDTACDAWLIVKELLPKSEF